MATVEDILLPDIGDFSGVELIEILVKPGDRIVPEQSLLTLESDKATIEIPSPVGGVVASLLVRVGDKLSQGDRLMRVEIEASGEAADEVPDGHPTPSPDTGSTGAPETPTPPLDARSTGAPDGRQAQAPDARSTGTPAGRQAETLGARSTGTPADQAKAPGAGTPGGRLAEAPDTRSTGTPADRQAEAPGARSTEAPDAPSAEPPPRAPGEVERRQAPVLPRPEDMAAIARGRTPHASPAVRRFARELGVDLARVKGSGPKGRVLKDDVQGFVKQALAQGGALPPAGTLPFALPPAPAIDHARFGPIERVALPRIKKLSGTHLHRAWLTVPHVTQFDEADITDLEAFRKGQGAAAGGPAAVKLTLLPFLLKAVAAALQRMPILKAALDADGEHLVMRQYTHIGVAVDTPQGLVVPVLRDVERKGLGELAAELAEVSAKARAGKLLPGDLQGGCFSISSLGGIGGTAFTPIVNAPEAAILGVSRATMKPVWNGDAFVPRLMLPLSLSYDHRVVDGADGVRFTSLLAGLLGDIRRLLL